VANKAAGKAPHAIATMKQGMDYLGYEGDSYGGFGG